ncbi:sensor histidine kinase [Actinomadura welshii]
MSELSLRSDARERPGPGRHSRSPRRNRTRRDAGRRGGRAVQLSVVVLPSLLMAALGLIAVAAVINVGTSTSEARLALVSVSAGALFVVAGAITAAEMTIRRARRSPGPPEDVPGEAHPRLDELTSLIRRGRADLRDLSGRIAAGETSPPRGAGPPPAPTADPVAQLAFELRTAQDESWNALVELAGSQRPERPDSSEERVGLFVNLSLRMQTLAHRALQCLDELENRVEDPDLLKGLFRVDHLTARLRRQAESLAVIGGSAPRRQWSRPVSVYEVLRSAIAEVEQYHRVKVVPPVEGALHGGAVADTIHLLAELIENATRFAPPRTDVLLRVETVAAGIAIEIEDRGLGIPHGAQRRLNGLLAGTERAGADRMVAEGQIGLLVVSALSRRHKIAVRLQTNIYGGTQAVVLIPDGLIGSDVPGVDAHPAAPPPRAPSPAAPPPAASSPVASPPVRDTPPEPIPAAHDPGGPPGAGTSGQWNGTPESASIRPDRLPGAAPAGGGRRPELPRRRPQANLRPELREALAASDGGPDDADVPLNPGFMAAFRKGMHSGGLGEHPADETGD